MAATYLVPFGTGEAVIIRNVTDPTVLYFTPLFWTSIKFYFKIVTLPILQRGMKRLTVWWSWVAQTDWTAFGPPTQSDSVISAPFTLQLDLKVSCCSEILLFLYNFWIILTSNLPLSFTSYLKPQDGEMLCYGITMSKSQDMIHLQNCLSQVGI